MNTDDLDTRIRDLVATAVADAPPAPALDARPTSQASSELLTPPVHLVDRRRHWALAAAGALTAAAVAVTVVMINRDEPRLAPSGVDSTVPVTTEVPATTEVPTTAPVATAAQSVTTTAPVETTTAPAVTAPPSIITAGADGVWQQTAEGSVQWTSEPMATALLAPDGTMIVQRVTEYSSNADTATAGDSWPLRIATPGATPETFFGDAAEPVDGWYRIHDVAVVDGRPVMLYERQAAVSSGVETPPGELLLFDLTTGTVDVLAASWGGWESGSSRMHLSNNGFIVGEYYSEIARSFSLQYLLGDTDITAEGLGIEPVYEDCSTCPRLFTIDRAGNTIAWLDGTELAVWNRLTPGEPSQRFPLGDVALSGVSNMSLGDGYVVLDRNSSFSDPADPPLRVDFDGTVTELTGQTATLSA